MWIGISKEIRNFELEKGKIISEYGNKNIMIPDEYDSGIFSICKGGWGNIKKT